MHTLILTAVFLALCNLTPSHATDLKVWLTQETPAQGSILVFRMKKLANPATNLELSWNGVRTKPVEDPNHPTQLVALFAVAHNAPTGVQQITVSGSIAGKAFEQKIAFAVRDGKFKSEKLKVDPSKLVLSAEDRARTKQEAQEVRALYASPELNALWKGKFRKPVKSKLSSVFGTNRVFNGETKGHHSGADLRATTGTKIRASNFGRVRLAKELFYAGNAVILDHGAGLFTIYAHLSRIDVQPGDVVKPNQVIGLSGATGRVNGPHLHWGVRIHGVEADPMQLLTAF